MKRFASIVCLALVSMTLSSCGVLYGALGEAYFHQGRNPKLRKYIPVVRDFGGFNGREIWLYSPSQLAIHPTTGAP